MADLSGFNANEVEPQVKPDPLPAGQYLAVISASEEKVNSKQTGSYLKLEFTVVEGEYEGRKLWTNLNLNNPNAQAEQIAKSELSAICRAVDVMTPQDSSDLHDLPLIIKVAVEKRKDTGEAQNRIKGYLRKGEAANSSEASSPAARKPAPSGGPGSTPPWARG